MSGRGKGKNNSSSKGGGHSGANKGRSDKPYTKKTVDQCTYYIGSAKQSSDYETTTELLINYVKQFDYGADIAKALKTLEEVDFLELRPVLSVSKKTDEAEKALENKQLEMMFRDDYAMHQRRVLKYEDNKIKAYAKAWERCSKALQQKLQQRKDFIAKIEDNPIELLKAIKEHAMSYQENRYPMMIINDALRNLLECKQQEKESLIDYAKRFKSARDVLESQIGGPIELTKYMEEYHVSSEVAFEKYMAYLVMTNSDKTKYGSLLDGLNNQYSLKNDQYPDTMVQAVNVLSNHKFDSKPKEKKNNNEKKQSEKTDGDETPKLSFAQMEGKCYCCGKAGHKSPKCRFKDKPKDEWAINKAKVNDEKSHANVGTEKLQKTEKETSKDEPTAWSGAHIAHSLQMFQVNQTRDWILLDTGSTTTMFCNPNLVRNIRQVNEHMNVSTNGGVMTTNLKADLPDWGEVWYSPHAIINIFNFGEMERRYPISYHHDESKFTVHLPQKTVDFKNEGNDLYLLKPQIKNNINYNFVNTVEENKEFYTHRQFEKAKKARDLYHAIGTPSVDDFKAIIRMNAIRNNPVTLQDIQLAENIFGPDIGSLKGKGTRTKPIPVVSDYVEVPAALYQKQHRVVLCIDTLKINGLFFLATISQNIKYRTVQWISAKTTDVYMDALKEVFRIYNRASFRIMEIRCDNEYTGLMDDIEDEFHVRINYASAQEHVPEAERNNRVLKERYRAIYHRLPYQHLPKLMIKHLAYSAARYLNYFPSKTGVSSEFSPRMIMHQEALDYHKQCAYPFGSYVQANTETADKNANHPRTLDCIYLRPTSNHQGGHELMDVRTGRSITRQYITQVPITSQIIETIHQLAVNEKAPKGLKIETKTGTILYDAAWLAGVDYTTKDNEEIESKIEDVNEDIEIDDEYIEPNDGEDNTIDEDEYYNIPSEYETNEENIDPNEVEELLGGEIYEQENEDEENENDNDNEEENGINEQPNDNPSIANNEETENKDNNRNINQADDEIQVHDSEEETIQDNERRTRSGRITRPPNKLSLHQSHLLTQGHEVTEYTKDMAKIIAITMCAINSKYKTQTKNAKQFVQTYTLKKGLKVLGDEGKQAAHNEMKQLHDRTVFEPIRVEDLTTLEKKRAMESLIFLAQKRDGTVKARTCANGSTQRAYIPKEETASPTAMVESILITGTIEAKQQRDVMTTDIPNAFVQTGMVEKDGVKTIMKIRGVLVDMLIEIDKGKYEQYVVYERGEKVLYVRMLKALYGMLESALLYYKKFIKDIETIGFKLNPYDPCVANRIVNGKQHTITWHVDDVKSSHVDSKVNDEFANWLQDKYGTIKKLETTRGKTHDYLAMKLDYTVPGVLRVDMTDYVKGMVKDFPEKIEGTVKCPWIEKLFTVDDKSPKLTEAKKEIFHTFVMKGMFVCKRARQDIQPAIAFLSTRVREPNESDWTKLVRVMKYLKGTQDEVLTLEADDTQSIKWHVDAAFAVHKDMKSHTGATMTLGKGTIISVSTKQKINTKSSTEAELISIDDVIAKIMWVKLFIEAQGFKIKSNTIFRDNLSSMKLEENGKESSGKRTRHFDIKYFYITDLIKRGEISIEFCPTNEMTADYMTKPLVGAKYYKFKKNIMNNESSDIPSEDSRSVLEKKITKDSKDIKNPLKSPSGTKT